MSPSHDNNPLSHHGGDRATEPPQREQERPHEDEVDEISLLELGDVLLKRWKLIIVLPAAGALIGLLLSLNATRLYEATATFIPETGAARAPAGRLAAIANQFGIGSMVSSSPQLYETILRSRTFLQNVLDTRFSNPATPDAADSIRLFDFLQPGGETEAGRNESARAWLRSGLIVSIDGGSNVMRISFRSTYPDLSADLANTFVDFLGRFNVDTRQSSARVSRRFIEERLADAAEELRRAEEDLEQYMDQNRELSAPQLQFPYQRLQRQVTITQEVYLTLRRQYEDARIQEVNDTPVITVIDLAIPPLRGTRFNRIRSGFFGLLLGGGLAVLAAFGLDFVERSRRRKDRHFLKFISRLASIRAELRSMIPWGGSGVE